MNFKQITSKYTYEISPYLPLCDSFTVFLGTLLECQNMLSAVSLHTFEDFIPFPPLMTPQPYIIFETDSLYLQKFSFLLNNTSPRTLIETGYSGISTLKMVIVLNPFLNISFY